jgi:hypothetical protein
VSDQKITGEVAAVDLKSKRDTFVASQMQRLQPHVAEYEAAIGRGDAKAAEISLHFLRGESARIEELANNPRFIASLGGAVPAAQPGSTGKVVGREFVDPATERERYYHMLLAEVNAPIWRFPLWYHDNRAGYHVLSDSHLIVAAKYKIQHAWDLFVHRNVTLALFEASGIGPGDFDCARHGRVQRPLQAGIFYGFDQGEHGLPRPVIDAVQSGQCARIMRLAGWREIRFFYSVNRVEYAVDCTGSKHFWDESGERYFPD